MDSGCGLFPVDSSADHYNLVQRTTVHTSAVNSAICSGLSTALHFWDFEKRDRKMLVLPTLVLLSSVSAVSAEIQLLVAGGGEARLRNVSSGNYKVLSTNDQDPLGIDFSYSRHLVFWTRVHTARVHSLNLVSETRAEFSLGSEPLSGIAVDWVYGHIYWSADMDNVQIGVASLDGSFQTALITTSLGSPRGLAVHPGRRFLFFSDWGDSPKIERCGLNGKHRYTIIDIDIEWPNGLTIDYEEDLLYWVDARTDSISYSDFNGNNRKTLLQGVASVTHGFDISVFRGLVFWSDWGNDKVYRCNKSESCRTIDSVAESSRGPFGIAVYHPKRQISYLNYCGANNGGCAELCLPGIIDHVTCVCSDGHFVDPTNSSNCVLSAPTTTSDVVETTPTTSAAITALSTTEISTMKATSNISLSASTTNLDVLETTPTTSAAVTGLSTTEISTMKATSNIPLSASTTNSDVAETTPTTLAAVTALSTTEISTMKAASNISLSASTTNSDVAETTPTTSAAVTALSTTEVSRKKAASNVFYMLLMGFSAESETKAVRTLDLIRDAAKKAGGHELTLVATEQN